MARIDLAAPGIALVFLACACGPQENGPPLGGDEVDREVHETEGEAQRGTRLTDDAGRTHRFEEAPDRILSLVPAATEVILALDGRKRLVGRTDFDTLAAVRSLPSVGGGLEPNLEVLLELDPELVIRYAAESDPGTPRQLDRVGVPHFAVQPESVQDIRRMVERLGAILGRTEAAARELEELDRRLAEVEAAVADRPRPRVAYLISGRPLWAASEGTFVDELLEVAGGTNVFRDLPAPYAEVSLEALLDREVDRILLVEGETAPPGVPSNEVTTVPGYTRSPSLALPEAARTLAERLHPEAFP